MELVKLVTRIITFSRFSFVKLAILLIIFLSVHQYAESKELAAFSTYELVKNSDLIVKVEVNDVKITKSKEFVMTRDVNVEHYQIHCTINRLLYPQEFKTKTISLQLKDNDYWGKMVTYRQFNKGNNYLLFLAQRKDGKYYPLQEGQGIARIESDVINFYYGTISKSLAEEFISLFVHQVKLEQKGAELAKNLIAKNDFNDPRQTVAAFRLLVSLPPTVKIDDYLIKSLESNSGEIVNCAIWSLSKRGSKEGVEATIELYFKLKRENGWRKYKDGWYVLPYQFNEILRNYIHSPAYRTIRRYEDKYPEEKELFEGIK